MTEILDLLTSRKSANTTDSLRTPRKHHRPPSNSVWPLYTAEWRSDTPTTDSESIVWSTNLRVVQDLRAHRNVRPRFAVPATGSSGKSATSLKHVTRDSHRGVPGFHRACGHSCRSHGTLLLAIAETFSGFVGLVGTACRSHGTLMLANPVGQ